MIPVKRINHLHILYYSILFPLGTNLTCVKCAKLATNAFCNCIHDSRKHLTRDVPLFCRPTPIPIYRSPWTHPKWLSLGSHPNQQWRMGAICYWLINFLCTDSALHRINANMSVLIIPNQTKYGGGSTSTSPLIRQGSLDWFVIHLFWLWPDPVN